MLYTDSHIFTGLLTDLAPSKQSSGNLVDARNIRITTNEDNTLLSITNEKGPLEITLKGGATIPGNIIGSCILNNYLVLFTTSKDEQDPDRIIKIDFSQSLPEVTLLYIGTLGFDVNHPIEAIGDYESEAVLKVYWTDGLNLPRIIDITKTYDSKWNGWFDFIPELLLEEKVEVEKIQGSSGGFSSGVIQYAFTYYTKYRLESNIWHVTPLYYISPKDRGAAPDEKVSNAFKIKIEKLDSHFDYIRIYSIHRTSLDGTPSCKRVIDLEIKDLNTISYTDTGTSGDFIDPYSLLYLNAQNIVKASTLCAKDGTLFLGGLTLEDKNLELSLPKDSINLTTSVKTVTPTKVSDENYIYYNALNTQASGFKLGEYYRLGYLLLDKYGIWSKPIFLQDYPINFKFDEDSTQYSNIAPYLTKDGKMQLPSITGILSENLKSILQGSKYKKIRPLVVFPENHDKCVLYLGVMNSALYTEKLRGTDKNAPEAGKPSSIWAQSSWFFRPVMDYGFDSENSKTKSYHEDTNHYTELLCSPYSSNDKTNGAHILKYLRGSALDKEIVGPTGLTTAKATEIQGYYSVEDRFKVDGNFCTINIPDLIFEESLQNLPLDGYKFRITGIAPIYKTLSTIKLETSSPTLTSLSGGFNTLSLIGDYSKGIISGAFYDDYLADDVNKNDPYIKYFDQQSSSVKWLIYTWQGEGSLNNDTRYRGSTPTSVLKKKVISNLRVSTNTCYFFKNNVTPFKWEKIEKKEGNGASFLPYKKSVPLIFNSNELSIIKLKDLVYLGNIDTLLIPKELSGNYFAFNTDGLQIGSNVANEKNSIYQGFALSDIDTPYDTPIKYMTWRANNLVTRDADNPGDIQVDADALQGIYVYDKHDGPNKEESWYSGNDAIGDYIPSLSVNKNSVRMKYKSTPHLAISFYSKSKDDGLQYWWEAIKDLYSKLLLDNYEDGKGNHKSIASALPIVEFYKDYNENVTFGGQSSDAFKANKWLPAGPAVSINDGKIEWIWGDTWYNRWDCLKTYPFTPEDTNQVVEIGSFMLESRVNLDGRYDKNRGQIDNTMMSPTNFNLFNPVYSLKDNFFTYTILDDDLYNLLTFTNQITWGLTKIPNQDVDIWTNITLASTYNMDGSKGKITALETWKDSIICFLEKEINTILFNSRVLISTSDGVPIELSNSAKVDGKRVLLEGSGCSNKYTILPTPSALYFIDSTNKHLMALSDSIVDLSLSKNMTSWFKKQLTSEWNPNIYSLKLFYDNTKKDLYIMNSKESLCYNTVLGEFTSFMSYKKLPLMFNILNTFYCIPPIESLQHSVYKLFSGEYNNFFGEKADYSISFISNGRGESDASTITKIFDTFEFRGDSYIENKVETQDPEVQPALEIEKTPEWRLDTSVCPFNKIQISNEYQDSGLLDINLTNIKLKFRVWRGLLPRNKDNKNSRERIRNPWAKITLQWEHPEQGNTNIKSIIHDMIIKYSM